MLYLHHHPLLIGAFTVLTVIGGNAVHASINYNIVAPSLLHGVDTSIVEGVKTTNINSIGENASDVLVTTASSEASTSWWHAMAGLPVIFNRRPKRKLSKSVVKSSIDAVFPVDDSVGDVDMQLHRFLAFGDYTDPTFSCPATTTCPLVCVASIEDCPSDATCPGSNPDSDPNADGHEYEACADGTCADLTNGESCDAEAESPCECDALPVVCPKQVDLFDVCHERFQDFYDANAECIEAQEDALPQVDFNGPAFKSCYIPFIAITGLMLLWCAFNQRFVPVDGSCTSLQCAIKEKENEKWTQTGYKKTIVGDVLYYLIIFVHLAIQGLLLFLTIEYYVQQEAGPALENLRLIFHDEIQVLMAFEIVWMVGIVWCFFLKYPASIRSLFLRRCTSDEASHVAVCAPVNSVDTMYEKKWIVKFLASLTKGFYGALNFIYSIRSEGAETGLHYKTAFCPVKVGEWICRVIISLLYLLKNLLTGINNRLLKTKTRV